MSPRSSYIPLSSLTEIKCTITKATIMHPGFGPSLSQTTVYNCTAGIYIYNGCKVDSTASNILVRQRSLQRNSPAWGLSHHSLIYEATVVYNCKYSLRLQPMAMADTRVILFDNYWLWNVHIMWSHFFFHKNVHELLGHDIILYHQVSCLKDKARGQPLETDRFSQYYLHWRFLVREQIINLPT